MDCIFCKIINKEIPSYTLYENSELLIFLDINPKTNGHMLIVPKNHFKNILDLDKSLIVSIYNITIDMYNLLKSKLNIDGLTIQQNNELGQDIKHYHIHLIPTYKKHKKENIEIIYNKLKH